MLKRKIYAKLLEWKEKSHGRTALFLDGARRVGKSFIAKQFAENEYRSHILIDFAYVSDEIKDLFKDTITDLNVFFRMLSEYYNVKLYEAESLIIFDEVQMFPRAREVIKYLVEDGRYHYLETGSLVSIRKNVKNIMIPSEERHLSMYPLDFEEFLWAKGNDTLMDYIRECFENRKALVDGLHRKAIQYFREYMIVGGMPQVVNEYIEQEDFEEADQIKRDILRLYADDIEKYANGSAKRVRAVFEGIPDALTTHEKKFKLAALEKGARYRDYEDSFFWLQDSMTVNICYNAREPRYGLKLNRDRVTLKLYMADTGLLISHAFDEKGVIEEQIYKKLLFDKLDVNIGMILENEVAQMLTASGHKLYFFSNGDRTDKESRMEVDFLIAKSTLTSRKNIVPIEVKSGKRYTLTSVRKYCRKYADLTNMAYVIHGGNYSEQDQFRFIPYYMVPLV